MPREKAVGWTGEGRDERDEGGSTTSPGRGGGTEQQPWGLKTWELSPRCEDECLEEGRGDVLLSALPNCLQPASSPRLLGD